jgi:hypothetical protein
MYDDPKYPCAYCVGWVEPDPVNPEKAYPIHADGRRVRRLYRYVHRECEMMAMAYSGENDSAGTVGE